MADNATPLNYRQVQELLARYYDAQTTAAEERLLRDYFSRADVPPEHQPDRRLFLALSRAEESPAPAVNAERLMAKALASLPEDDATAPAAKPRRLALRRTLWSLLAAACLAAAFLLPLVLPPTSAPATGPTIVTEDGLTLRDTYDDPAEAAAAAEGALNKFSESLDKGLAQLDKINL